jgi:Gram-negative bacterial TonB protein C-terminal
MKIKRIIGTLLVFSLVSVFASVDGVSAGQNPAEKKTVLRYDDIVEIGTFAHIPEATEPCTAEESEWWNQLRNAHGDILIGYKKRKENAIAEAKAKFFQLLYEGQLKSYRVPLQDRPPLILVHGKPGSTFLAQKHHTRGTVELAVEFQANGSVGDIRVISRLEDGLTDSAIDAQRQAVFLPAIRNRAFVNYQNESVKVLFEQGTTHRPGAW